MSGTYFDVYNEYTKESECPRFYHRWGAISSLAAFLGRDCWFQFGHFHIYPNMYVKLIGSPGTRKSTAIKIAKQIVVQAGYENIAAEKTSKEKFLFDLAAQNDHSLLDDNDGRKQRNGVDILEQNLWGEEDYASKPPAETYVAADEFNDFLGQGNMEFISLLGNLWDFEGVFKHRVKNGKSIAIPNPTINIFGGNTPAGFAMCFPPEALGQGFFSRLLLVYGEPTGIKITFPKPPTPEQTAGIVAKLISIKSNVRGELTLSSEAESILDRIYKSFPPLEDPRFASYNNRRFTHLLKLCILCAANRTSLTIEKTDVLLANTILAHTEAMMPKALGEFGKGKHSAVAHTIMEIIDAAVKPVMVRALLTAVHQDINSPADLAAILQGLEGAGKIQKVGGGYLPKKLQRELVDASQSLIDWNLLSDEERSNGL